MDQISVLGTTENPLRVAIVGAGPSGFYATDHLLKQTDVVVKVDLFDRLPTPYGLVRNPWDRMVSYYHWLRTQGFAHPAVGLAKSHDFSGFLNHPQTVASLRLWPYGAYLRLPSGEEKKSLFIRLEHFSEDAKPFETRLGFALALPRANESDRGRDWRPYYSAADAALVGEVCGEDVARFGYRFDP